MSSNPRAAAVIAMFVFSRQVFLCAASGASPPYTSISILQCKPEVRHSRPCLKHFSLATTGFYLPQARLRRFSRGYGVIPESIDICAAFVFMKIYYVLFDHTPGVLNHLLCHIRIARCEELFLHARR